MRALVVVTALLGLAGPALAQVKPPFAPTRDVTVTYHVTTPGRPPSEVRLQSRAGGTPMRVDLLTEGTYLLLDRTAGVMTMVVPEERMALDLPLTAGQQDFVLNDQMRFARRGADTVAGLRCTVWDVTLAGERSTACITEDGVIVRLLGRRQGAGRSTMEASAVVFEGHADDLFVPPAEFEREQATPQ